MSSEKGNNETRLAVFAAVWALAQIQHYVILYPNFVVRDQWQWWPVFALAIALACKPRSTYLLVALLVAQLVCIWPRMPFVPNHIVLEVFIAIGLLASFASTRIQRTPKAQEIPLCSGGIPTARGIVLLMYVIAALHKLNWDYWDSGYSSAAQLMKLTAGHMNWMEFPAPAYPIAIAGSVLIELSIPFLLLRPSTRVVGIGLSLAFHTALGIAPASGIKGFSATMTAALVLFLPKAYCDQISEALASTRLKLFGGKLGAIQAAYGATLIWLVVLSVGIRVQQGNEQAYVAGGQQWFFFVAAVDLGFLLLVISRMRQRKGHQEKAGSPAPISRSRTLLTPLILGLFILNGLCPYLGLKTETSFSMFSNLRTEESRTNHWFIPSRLQIFDFQRDTVEIIEADHPKLARRRKDRLRMTYFEFRRVCSQAREINVTYRRNGGAVQRLSRENNVVCEQPAASPLNYLLAKLFRFKPVQTTEHYHWSH